jgi:hypothetical protein
MPDRYSWTKWFKTKRARDLKLASLLADNVNAQWVSRKVGGSTVRYGVKWVIAG